MSALAVNIVHGLIIHIREMATDSHPLHSCPPRGATMLGIVETPEQLLQSRTITHSPSRFDALQ